MNKHPTLDQWLTVDDIAHIMNVHPGTVRRWCNQRRVPYVKIGTAVRFAPDHVNEIKVAYTKEPEQHIEVDHPNPHYSPRKAVVVPMKPPAA